MESVNTFCKRVAISRRLFDKLRSSGDGPAVTRLGTRVLISPDAADLWLRAHEEQPEEEGFGMLDANFNYVCGQNARSRCKMSAPKDRLLWDRAARELELEAAAAVAMNPLTPPIVQSLAASVIALCCDRSARMELAIPTEEAMH